MCARKGAVMGRYIACFVLLGGSVFIATLSFSGRPLDGALVSDFFFLSGMAFLLYGLIFVIANSGLFRAASFGFQKLHRHVFRGERTAGGGRDGYYNYISTRKKKRPLPFVAAGVVLLLVSTVLAMSAKP